MSDYLVKELDSKGNIEIRYQTEVVDGWGETRLEQLTLRDRESGQNGYRAGGGLRTYRGGTEDGMASA
jgi:thioredoxin reductase (NADPH)